MVTKKFILAVLNSKPLEALDTKLRSARFNGFVDFGTYETKKGRDFVLAAYVVNKRALSPALRKALPCDLTFGGRKIPVRMISIGCIDVH